jgi:hypothetical protein
VKAILYRLLRKEPPKPPPLQRVREDYIRWDGLRQGWGQAVTWFHGFEPQGVDDHGRILGFDSIMDPRVGDIFYTEMKSGRTLLWVVDEVQSKSDPPDMYGADLSRIGYEDEVTLAPSTYVKPTGWQFLR